MYKMIIVDDEPIIRKGLKGCLDYEQLGIQVVAEADNGKTALDLIDRHKPDIVLLDVNMPIIHGLDLMQALHMINSSAKVVFVTGYDNFDYVKKAIRYQAFDYLLKPVNEKELMMTLNNAIKDIVSEQKSKHYVDSVEQILADSLEVIDGKVMTDFLKGHTSYKDIQKVIDRHGIKLTEAHVMLAVRLLLVNDRRQDDNLGKVDLTTLMAEHGSGLSWPHWVFLESDQIGYMMVETDRLAEIQDGCQALQKKLMDIHGIAADVTCMQAVAGTRGLQHSFRVLSDELQRYTYLNPLVMLAKIHIQTRYSETEFTLNSFADQMNISPSYLSKLFKSDLGMSFKEYLTQVRIQRAKDLMSNPMMKIYEVAECVGYSTQHYFSSAFKKVTGCSPKQYQTHQAGDR